MSLTLGRRTLGTPVVLAPMAGVTNAPFRQLCREAARAGLPAAGESGADAVLGADVPEGIFVSEMVTSRALVERTPESMRIITPAPDETVRSVQLYGVDPATVGAAVRMLVSEDRADHIDLNFGCPVPKVTKRGGGAVLPWKRDLFAAIVRVAVREAARGDVPLTVKMRMGIDADHLTYLEAGLRAQDAGAAWVALHARTAAEYYSGHAHRDAIARLKETVTDIPVLGNGDIWSAQDALDMVAETGCDGVVVGRGCQGRPWLFTDLVAGFAGTGRGVRPGLRDVARVLRRHGELMIEHFDGDEGRALRELRKHMAWYLKGYAVGGDARRGLALVDSLADLDAKLAALDLDQPYPGEAAEGQRGRAGTPKIPSVPQGWLDSREIDAELAASLHEAELSVSGG
ncbi:tRNA dihydrouridine synthase DusB [Litorihabitans aurantiacus]|uniref:tRNA dihydrouridine synthase DusB n=1 Tax=Litorihabitans aurantiacus TaxID=1930061 RepID=A0AA37UM37_9MICO|nr:tRNA dihydrouridine synthase DusB [Litorihabitans aurantiacus]GMA30985.1 tRNA dihydrouridine synthase DusB [Litorihabitans aurantiacus]